MTILLKKLTHTNPSHAAQPDTYSISQATHERNIALEQLFVEFEIKPTAVIIIDDMKFMLKTVERVNEFANRMLSEDSPLSLIVKMRKEDIDAYGYNVKADFVYDYYRNKKAAFEKLFQEPAHDWKMDRYETDDPERIYDTYFAQGKYSHMTEVALFA
ncbi:hypothetical protein [Paenibacillus terrae]|uniref:hypothetical protein n=1 Tax=Paenibacillus terrae TaxID=159743 RepID=UPI000A4FBBE8|nr:hypothetical protein [Paenibacillus terrae]